MLPLEDSDATGSARLPEEVELLLALADRLRARFSDVAGEHDLTPAQASALWHLRPGDPRPMHEMARLLRCDASNVTGMADRLESRGLVARRAAADDRRVRTLELTDSGVQLRARLQHRLASPPAELARLDSAERASFVHLLRRALAEQ